MVLVSVVGDFFSSVVPIFYEFKDKINTHIIISDDSKRDSRFAKKFKKGVDEFIKKYKLPIKNLFYSIDEDSFESLERAKKFILKNSNNKIYINSTDGLSSINTFFSLKMLPLGCKIISYDMYDNEYHLIDINGMKREKIKKIPSIIEHFMLKGIKVISKGSKNFALTHQKEIKSIFQKYHQEYKNFKYEMTTKKHLPSRTIYKNIYHLLDKMNLTNNSLEYKYLFKILTGDLFEYYIFLLMKDLKFDDIEIGVEIDDEEIKNEFDLLLMKDNHLHTIECKHRGFKNLDLDDLIYKYSTLRRVIDEDAKGVIISLANRYSQSYIKRALSQNIALLRLNKNLKDSISAFLLEGNYNENYFRAFKRDSYKIKNRYYSKRVNKTKKRNR